MTFTHPLYGHDFGVFVPRDNDVRFVHQSGGHSCKQEIFEGGIFLPVDEPKIVHDDHGVVDIISEWVTFNAGTGETTVEWKNPDEIRRALLSHIPFEIELLRDKSDGTARGHAELIPEGYPRFGSWYWAEVTDAPEPDRYFDGEEIRDYTGLVGETVCIIVPNCD